MPNYIYVTAAIWNSILDRQSHLRAQKTTTVVESPTLPWEGLTASKSLQGDQVSNKYDLPSLPLLDGGNTWLSLILCNYGSPFIHQCPVLLLSIYPPMPTILAVHLSTNASYSCCPFYSPCASYSCCPFIH